MGQKQTALDKGQEPSEHYHHSLGSVLSSPRLVKRLFSSPKAGAKLVLVQEPRAGSRHRQRWPSTPQQSSLGSTSHVDQVAEEGHVGSCQDPLDEESPLPRLESAQGTRSLCECRTKRSGSLSNAVASRWCGRNTPNLRQCIRDFACRPSGSSTPKRLYSKSDTSRPDQLHTESPREVVRAMAEHPADAISQTYGIPS